MSVIFWKLVSLSYINPMILYMPCHGGIVNVMAKRVGMAYIEVWFRLRFSTVWVCKTIRNNMVIFNIYLHGYRSTWEHIPFILTARIILSNLQVHIFLYCIYTHTLMRVTWCLVIYIKCCSHKPIQLKCHLIVIFQPLLTFVLTS